MARVKDDVDQLDGLGRRLSDLEVLYELAREEDDESFESELETGLADFERDLAVLEVLALLGGEFDDRDAIVTIHPGAGGTESQDWAEMLCGCCPLGRAARVQGRLPGGRTRPASSRSP